MKVGDLFSFSNDYGVILAVVVAPESTRSHHLPETWIKVGWLSGSVTWEEWETNIDCFKIINKKK